MLSWDQSVLLWTWLVFGVVGALALLDGWKIWTRRTIGEHVGVRRFVLFAALIMGGLGTLLVAGVFHLALDVTRKQRERARSDRHSASGAPPVRQPKPR
jgi:branched-subunit amino acid ABC-type transport system permease component